MADIGTRLGFSPPAFQALRRVVALGLFSYLVWERAHSFMLYRTFVWGLETVIFVVLFVNIASRRDPVASAEGFWEEIYPFVCAAMPFALTLFKYNASGYPTRFAWGVGLLGVGDLITVVGLATLGRSFGISIAARHAVTGGIYRWIRHPVYLGEIIASFGFAVLRLQVGAIAVAALFAVMQTYRGTLEERKLSRTFPEYDEYRRRTGRYIPGLFKGK